MVPVVCVSYGGDLAELAVLPGYGELREACEDIGVTLLEAPRSITGMVNVGTGAVDAGAGRRRARGRFLRRSRGSRRRA